MASIPPSVPGLAGLWPPRGSSSAAFSSSGFSAARSSTRSYLLRLPLLTRLILGLMVLLYFLSLQSAWDVRAWGSITPRDLSLGNLYRTNTFPLIHVGLFHTVMNLFALAPLLDRFEHEHGTLTTGAFFFGPFGTLPALIYAAIERFLGLNTTVMGASVWVFLLLGVEAIKANRAHPSFMVATVPVPTWTTPLAVAFVVAVLIPGTSLLGHLSGLAVGYLCGLGYLKFLAPPEKVLRWIEGRLNLLGRLPHYVSVDQKTYGRFGVLPSVSGGPGSAPAIGLVGSTQRLGS